MRLQTLTLFALVAAMLLLHLTEAASYNSHRSKYKRDDDDGDGEDDGDGDDHDGGVDHNEDEDELSLGEEHAQEVIEAMEDKEEIDQRAKYLTNFKEGKKKKKQPKLLKMIHHHPVKPLKAHHVLVKNKFTGEHHPEGHPHGRIRRGVIPRARYAVRIVRDVIMLRRTK